MTITIDMSVEEAERLDRKARRAGQDLPSFVHDVLERASSEDEVTTADAQNAGDADSFFGIWSGRDDLADSAAWVTKERAAWQNRPGRPA